MRDAEMVESIQAGEAAGIAEAYDRYAQALYGYCRSLLGEPADAVDAIQDTFIIAAAIIPSSLPSASASLGVSASASPGQVAAGSLAASTTMLTLRLGVTGSFTLTAQGGPASGIHIQNPDPLDLTITLGASSLATGQTTTARVTMGKPTGVVKRLDSRPRWDADHRQAGAARLTSKAVRSGGSRDTQLVIVSQFALC
jgi:Sigma-70 region 2